ncbi:hypothetical protein HanRHA438_Chr03g0143881 [Helianthus annuus]|nr:hypothetical protein HanRHA438_Chr03g0143881 [Helianthus annuus]
MNTVPAAKHHQPLHNFTLPFLKWGQRIHHHRRRSPLSSSDLHNRRTTTITTTEREIDEQNGDVSPHENNNSNLIDVDVATGDCKPWNLRPRRLVIDTVDSEHFPVMTCSKRLPRDDKDEERKKKNRRLWISLSKDEIEEDIYAFTGSRPCRRPKKRSKVEQKQLDNVFPGLYLVGFRPIRIEFKPFRSGDYEAM